MRALVVDDDALRSRALGRLYRSRGYDVTYAHDSAEAIDALHAERFDVATLDHNLGIGPNGEVVAIAITQLSPDARPRRVVVHSSSDEGAARMVAVLRSAGIETTREQL